MQQTISVDGYLLSKEFRGAGINRYLVNLLRQIEKITGGEEGPCFRILVPSVAEYETSGLVHRFGFEMIVQPLMRFRRAWRYGLVNSAVGQRGSDALFIPMPVPVYLKPKRLAVTIHDIVPLVFPEQYRSVRARIFAHTYLSSMRRADLIFTDSEYSKTDMVSRFGVPAEKIAVVYLGFDSQLFKPGAVDPSERLEVLYRRAINKPYVLHVGHGDPRKNLVRLTEAYERLTYRRRDLDFQLVLCGHLGWGYEPLLDLLKRPSLQGKVILTGPVPDRDLSVLFRSASCFALPSLYEGFGLPALEAMASGTPLMSSNRSSLPEVAGDAALYFDPESVEEMSAAMERILTDSALRERLTRAGFERAKRFSWEACARSSLAALKSL